MGVHMLISDLQRKDIVNTDGTRLGRIADIDVSSDGKVNYLIIEPNKMLRRISYGNEVSITFSQIVTIGNDVILVSMK